MPFLRRSAPQHLSSKLLLKLKLFFGLAAAMALWPLAPLHCSAQDAGNQDSAARVLAIKIFPPEYPPPFAHVWHFRIRDAESNCPP
jgi:hypothetical protein